MSERFINSPLSYEERWKRPLNFHAGKLDDISYWLQPLYFINLFHSAPVHIKSLEHCRLNLAPLIKFLDILLPQWVAADFES